MSVFRHSRELSATPESVFAAIRNPVRLARWWGPGWVHEMLPLIQIGWTWGFATHGPDAADYPNQSSFG